MCARLDVSWTIYVNEDSPNLGCPYFNFLGGYQSQKTPCIKLQECEIPTPPPIQFLLCFSKHDRPDLLKAFNIISEHLISISYIIIKSIMISIVMITQVTTLTLEEEGSRLCLHQIAEKDQVVTPSLFILIEDLDD